MPFLLKSIDKENKDEFDYVWQIYFFSAAVEKTGEAINSPAFYVECLDGTRWYLSIYPKGEVDEEYVDIYLTRCSEDKGGNDIPIIFTIELEAADSTRLESRTSGECIFHRNRSLGFTPYIKRKTLLQDMKSILLPNDVLTIHCKLEEVPTDIRAVKESTMDMIPEMVKREVPWTIKRWNRIREAYKNVQFTGEFKATYQMFIKKTDNSKNKIIMFTLKMLEAKYPNIYVRCCITVLNKEGSEVLVRTTHHHFSDKRDAISQKLWDRKEIKNSYLQGKTLSLQGKSLNLRCVLNMEVGKITFIRREDRLFEAPIDEDEELDKYIEQELIDDYENMFLSGTFSDVKVRVGNQVIDCHKCILYARSPVLSGLLDKALESSGGVGECVIHINDLDVVTLEKMIYFMYTDKIQNLNFATCMKLLGAGHKYQVKHLKTQCASYMSQMIEYSFENIYDILVAAHLYDEGDLKRRAIAYISEYFSRICLTIEWENFRKSFKELHAYTCKEIRRIKRI